MWKLNQKNFFNVTILTNKRIVPNFWLLYLSYFSLEWRTWFLWYLGWCICYMRGSIWYLEWIITKIVGFAFICCLNYFFAQSSPFRVPSGKKVCQLEKVCQCRWWHCHCRLISGMLRFLNPSLGDEQELVGRKGNLGKTSISANSLLSPTLYRSFLIFQNGS